MVAAGTAGTQAERHAAEIPPGRLEAPRLGLLTVEEAASFLRVSVRWIRTALKRDQGEPGSIPALRMPGTGHRVHWRFDPSELLRWAHAGFPSVKDWRWIERTAGPFQGSGERLKSS